VRVKKRGQRLPLKGAGATTQGEINSKNVIKLPLGPQISIWACQLIIQING